MFEMDGVPEATAREAMRLASHKLPIKCKFVVKGKELGGDVNEVNDIRNMSAAEMEQKSFRS